MSRYDHETVLAALRTHATAEMTPEDIERLAAPLDALNADDAELMGAYMVCGRCDARYSETQWAHLHPVKGGRVWQFDAFGIVEERYCAGCHAAMVLVERYGRRRPSPDTLPVDAIATTYHHCGACRAPIHPKHFYVERRERRDGRRALGRWCFCSAVCEDWG